MAKSHEIARTGNALKLSADKIVMLPVSEVRPYEKNPRKNANAVKFVKASIEQFGFKVPIIIDSNRVIVCGHTRLLAAKSLGMAEVPCIMADDLTDDQIRAFRLADNKVGEFAEWDMDLLGDELDAIADACDIDMGEFGFDLSGDEEETEVVEDEVPEEVEPVCKKGEVWQLGEHRLMCGDSVNGENLAKLMNGEQADMVFTDPPYLMGFQGNVHADGSKSFNAKFGAIKNDKMSREDGDKFIYGVFDAIKTYCKGAYYVCFYRLGLDYIFRALDAHGNAYRALIIWDKGNHTLSNSDYMSKYEPIVYGWFHEHNFYGDRSNFDIWPIQRTQKNELHPTMKPLALCEKAIKNSSEQGNIVLDLFGGSGSTMMACEQLGRKCRMMELDPHYCDVIIARWEKLTGQKAVKLEG